MGLGDSRAKNEQDFMGVNTNRREGMNLGFNIEKKRDGGRMSERKGRYEKQRARVAKCGVRERRKNG